MKCEICGNEYDKLGSIVNHVQRTHKMSYQLYYDTYIEPGIEHKCIICGNKQAFSHGKYLLTCNSTHCVRMMQHNTMVSLYGKSCRSQETIDKSRIKKYGSIDAYEKIVEQKEAEKKCLCGICGEKYRNFARLMIHVSNMHSDISKESYFEKYIENENHKCPYCNNKRKFGQFRFNKTCGSKECLAKYRSEHNAMKVPEYKQKAIASWIDKTPEEKKAISKKRENTCLAKFGYRHNWSSPELREKGQYATCASLYGNSNYHNVQKMQETNLNKFGVRSFSQTTEFNSAKWHKIKYDGLTFDSKYEIKYYNILKYFNISMEYHPKLKYRYEFDTKEHYYFPDFVFNGRIVDVKNSYLLKLMNVHNTKDNAKLHCMIDNGVEIVDGEYVLSLINSIFNVSLTEDTIVGMCLSAKFPGTNKWESSHPIWKSYVPGYKSPYSAWSDEKLIRKAVKNMLNVLNKSLENGKYKAFCVKHITELVLFARGKENRLSSLILDRFTIAKIAPKVTALHSSDLLKIIESSGKDISNGVYCPMAGFGGIVRGVQEWFNSRNLSSEGKIEAYDINKSFCDWYGWLERDALAQVVTTDKTVIACPPFGKKYEHWDGTPDAMSDISFDEWTKLLRQHIIAPDYIFIGPELDVNSKNAQCGLFKRKIGIQYYPNL